MYVMFCDETNLDPSQRARFFIYGGLIVSATAIGSLTDAIEGIRHDHGFQPDDSLKFQSSSRPGHVSQTAWNAAKGAVIAAARSHDARFTACLVLHNIARRQRDHLIDWQLNSVLSTFGQEFLGLHDDVGLVIMDRLGRQQEYPLMREKFGNAR